MKIAVIGSHGTFKTTLIYFLAGVLKAKGKNVGIIREVARACPYFKGGHGNILAQNWILLTQAQWEREYQDKYDYVLCDRSLIDNFLYAKEAYRKEEKELPDWIEPFILHHGESYSFLFKTTLSSKGLVHDGTRDTEAGWQREMDALICQYLEEKKIEHFSLPVSGASSFDEILEYAMRQARFMANKVIDMDMQTKIL